jgi:hypothetical protein
MNKNRLRESRCKSPVPFKKEPGTDCPVFILQEMEENMQVAMFGIPKKLFADFIHRVNIRDDHVIRVVGGTFIQDGKFLIKIPENPKIPQNTSLLYIERPVKRTIMIEKKLFLSLIFQVDGYQCYQEESVQF